MAGGSGGSGCTTRTPTPEASVYVPEDAEHFGEVRYLDLDYSDVNGQTALIWAARCGAANAVKCLLDQRASPDLQDNQGRSAIIWSSIYGHVKCIEALLERGASPDIRDRGFMTALLWSIKNKHKKVQGLLTQDSMSRRGGANIRISTHNILEQRAPIPPSGSSPGRSSGDAPNAKQPEGRRCSEPPSEPVIAE